MEHTPGPWEWDAEGTRGYPILYGGKDGGHAILGLPGDRSYLDIEEPDAKLISASPDLYAALKALWFQTDSWDVTEELRKQIRTAIAKAEGKTKV